jgi:hypothetical protein
MGGYQKRENNMKEYFDIGSIIIIFITLLLFALALFTSGFTHNLLLEAGVFLVSVKLIMMAYKNSIHVNMIERELTEIKELIKQNK